MELQNKLKQVQGPEPAKEVLLKDLLETRELLEEVLEGKQRVEEQLRLRERELTALKGALKEVTPLLAPSPRPACSIT